MPLQKVNFLTVNKRLLMTGCFQTLPVLWDYKPWFCHTRIFGTCYCKKKIKKRRFSTTTPRKRKRRWAFSSSGPPLKRSSQWKWLSCLVLKWLRFPLGESSSPRSHPLFPAIFHIWPKKTSKQASMYVHIHSGFFMLKVTPLKISSLPVKGASYPEIISAYKLARAPKTVFQLKILEHV
jgi:hypothetical protein